jgi:hypothetical protein
VNTLDLLLEIIFEDADDWFKKYKIRNQLPDTYIIHIYLVLCFNKITEVNGIKYGQLHTKDFIYHYYSKVVLREKIN